jgi:hypothetical protein
MKKKKKKNKKKKGMKKPTFHSIPILPTIFQYEEQRKMYRLKCWGKNENRLKRSEHFSFLVIRTDKKGKAGKEKREGFTKQGLYKSLSLYKIII